MCCRHRTLTEQKQSSPGLKELPGLSEPPGWIPRVDPFAEAPHTPTIAVCAIMKDERLEDVLEFIDYHRWVGVDTFYIRENGEECAIEDQLAPYVDAGVLDLGLLPGPKHPTQTNWYNECSRKASRLHTWVAFIDLDEFIVVLRRFDVLLCVDARATALRCVYVHSSDVVLSGHSIVGKQCV